MELIKLTCERCGGIMEIDENCHVCTCPYCGAKFLADESDGIKKFKIQQENERKIEIQRLKYRNIEYKRENRKALIRELMHNEVVIFLFFMIFMVSIWLIPLGIWDIQEMGRTYTPISSKEMIGKNYEEAISRFSDAGFKTIETVEVEDLKDSWFYNASSKVDTIEKITINGDDSFKKGDRYNKSDPVRIYYHIYPKGD